MRNEQLADFARQLDLGSGLRMGHGEAVSGGRDRDGVLGSAFEAVIGALYLDSGLDAVEQFMEPLLDSVRERVIVRAEIYDPKSRFQEWAQSQKLGTPQYVTVSAQWARIMPRSLRLRSAFKDQAYGTGKRTEQADRRASWRRRPRWRRWPGLEPAASRLDRCCPCHLTIACHFDVKSLELHGYKTFAARTVFEFARGDHGHRRTQRRRQIEHRRRAALGAGRTILQLCCAARRPRT